MVNVTSASDLPTSRAIAVKQNTTRKKSKESSAQPRYPARRAARWSSLAACPPAGDTGVVVLKAVIVPCTEAIDKDQKTD